MTLLDRVSQEGFAFVDLAREWSASPVALRDLAAASPFAFAERLLGVAPLLVERQPIRPMPGGRSFASSRDDTPLHTDSQLFLDMPAAIQVLVCIEPAARGGESILVDGADLAQRVDPALLFDEPRMQRFYFGERTGPTVALRGDHLTWTLAPFADDAVRRALAPELARAPRVCRPLAPGQALVASNHRMLHGRRPFEGARELVRLLVWLEEPLFADPEQRARALPRAAAPRHRTRASARGSSCRSRRSTGKGRERRASRRSHAVRVARRVHARRHLRALDHCRCVGHTDSVPVPFLQKSWMATLPVDWK